MIVYKCTNKTNGHFYIGMTIGPLIKRIKAHIYYSKKIQSHFYRALQKFGEDQFEWEVIDSSATTRKELIALEMKFIAELKPQYNMTKGGDGVLAGYKQSDEFKKKISRAFKGRVLSEEHKRKIALGVAGHHRVPWNKGLKK